MLSGKLMKVSQNSNFKCHLWEGTSENQKKGRKSKDARKEKKHDDFLKVGFLSKRGCEKD